MQQQRHEAKQVGSVNTERDQTFVTAFGREVRARRLALNMTIQDLAARLRCPVPMLEAIEAGAQIPEAPFVRGLEHYLKSGGTLPRMAAYFPSLSLPAHYRKYHDVERSAVAIRACDHSFIPGILQTADYARLVLSTRLGATPSDVDNRVAARISRQVLTSQGTRVHALIDEAALRRPIGGPSVMYDQLVKLDALFERPQVTIQVLPWHSANDGLNGSFTLADLPDGSTVAYTGDATEGRTTEDRGTLAMLGATFDSLARAALDREASRIRINWLVRELWTPSTHSPGQPG